MKNVNFYSVLFLGWILMTSNLIYAQDTEDLTSWDLLAKVTWVVDYEKGMYDASFDPEIEKLDEKDVTVKGYLFPLGFGPQSSEFLLTPYPINGCFYCVPGSAETMIYLPEVDLRAVPHTEVSIKGTFNIIRDSPYGLIYEMENISLEGS